jgi:hypothetical protein
MCLYVHPYIVARQRLRENVTAATNTQATTEEFLEASFSMLSVSYQKSRRLVLSRISCVLAKRNGIANVFSKFWRKATKRLRPVCLPRVSKQAPPYCKSGTLPWDQHVWSYSLSITHQTTVIFIRAWSRLNVPVRLLSTGYGCSEGN